MGTWKKPNYPLMEDWIKKMWCMHTMQCYSAMKRNTTVSFLEMWMDLEAAIQNEMSEKEKQTLYIHAHM